MRTTTTTRQRSSRRGEPVVRTVDDHLAWPLLTLLALVVVIMDDASGGVDRALFPGLGPVPFAHGSTGAGVPLFFAASAALICRAVRRHGRGGALLRWVTRVMPTYWVLVLVVLVVAVLQPLPASVSAEHLSVPDVIDNLILVPRLVATPWVDVSYWLLGAQLLALMGAVVLWPAVRSSRHALDLLLVLLLITPWVAGRTAGGPVAWDELTGRLWLATGAEHLYGWVIGVAFWAYATGAMSRSRAGVYLCAAVAAAVLGSGTIRTALVLGAVVIVVAASFALPDSRAPHPGLRFAANLSLPVFLTHNALSIALALALSSSGALNGWSVTAVLVLAPWALGTVVWFAVHRPLLRGLSLEVDLFPVPSRRRSRGRRTAPTAPSLS